MSDLAPRLLCLLAALAPAAPGATGDPPRVGFTSHWSTDPSRTWDMAFPDGTRWSGAAPAARPILVQVWYPAAPAADGQPLRRGQLLDLPGGDARTQALSGALHHYAMDVVAFPRASLRLAARGQKPCSMAVFRSLGASDDM